ncbi:MAG: LysR family transcriptional regulator [Eubacteriales bacterium]
MNTMFFKYAIEVQRTRSITQAAENLFMAQPNLSKAIKEAEDTLGYAIFERTSKGVVPTVKGSTFLEHAREILKQLEKMEAIGNSDNENVQRLSVSMPRGSYISKALIRFTEALDQSKGMELNILETGSVKTINNVVDGTFKIGIIRYQTVYEQYFQNFLAEKNLCSDLIWEFSYLALMSKQHILANKNVISPQDLRKSIEIIHGDTVVPYLTTDKDKLKKNPPTKKRIYLYERANQFELLSLIPSTFMWVSPIPQDMLKRYGLVQRRCDFPSNSYKDALIYQKKYTFSELEKKFIDKVYESKNEVSLREYQ